MKRHTLAVALAMGLTAAPALQAQNTHRSEHYTGAAFLFDIEEITVVYPAGPGQPVEVNRLSAERRARYLERAHGVRARVAADDRVGEAERTGNLLLLGWTNRLLGTEEAPHPFEHSGAGLAFLGIEDPDPSADLLLFHRSPYNPDRFLFFWSRIDPERDRFLVFPAVGSDWAILHDFRVVRQGMFRPGDAWPPTRDVHAEGDHRDDLAAIRRAWTRTETDHYAIYYDAEAIPEPEIRAIARAREAAFAKAVAALSMQPGKKRIRLYVYDDIEQKKAFTGVDDAVHSVPAHRQIHMVRRYARSASAHEDIHILARQAMGPSYLTTIYEGLALSEDGGYEGAELGLHTARMLQQDAFPALADLLDEESARALPDQARFPAAGMLLTWLRETLDRSALARVYSITEGSIEALAAAMGRPEESLESDFRAWIGKRAAAYRADLEFADHQKRAQESFVTGDYAAVAQSLRKALEVKPGDPQTLFNLASALMRTGELDLAEQELRRLLELKLGEAESRFVVFGRYQLGRVYDVQGKREEALVEYRRVLDLPDQHDSHRLAREAIETPVTADQLE